MLYKYCTEYTFILAIFFVFIFSIFNILSYIFYFAQSLHIKYRMVGREYETKTACIGRTLFV